MRGLLGALARRLSYANVVATLALFVALGGASYAAVQLPRASVGSAQLQSDAVTSEKVRDGSLLARDFSSAERARLKGARGARGATGARGAAGPAGPQGARGETGAAGASGAQGERGAAGEQGARGAQGLQGPRGEQGARGAQGERGEQGAAGSADAWGRAGNAGTTDESFLGTTDEQPLELRVDGTRALRLEPRGDGTPSVIGGAAANSVDAEAAGATIAGGGDADLGNSVGGAFGTIGGGRGNAITAPYATIAGGTGNGAGGETSTIGGGDDNHAGGDQATIAGGVSNVASGPYGTVAGGRQNEATGEYATVLGGKFNVASGQYSAALGFSSLASGDGSIAFGTEVTADDNGAVVLGDGSGGGFASEAENELAARFAGGIRLRTSADGSTGCDLPAGSGVFACTSDARLKHAFAPLDRDELLARLRGLEISTWQYRDEPGRVRHLGPTAQAFRAAFGLGADDTTIGQLDEAGVALAAGQALAERVDGLERRIAALEDQR
ncbi:tail fiber domain-containing protein [Conexibacter sp. JD483]|uniref:tail fiber domain-containing protein n=1 Tax=unclassified Conexibacter TaxID=2627773 RepID=UPI00271D9202|nr:MULTISPECIES: tail fiber domain-containing protein [unclassified Conexibacter]MDO8184550.1 tail fiber domain-containing protein [Conexibacter sp. CPCC 205706]MDO8197856.1 tail fiber domain-containing protein [Conexibacter sp. CPCC 205762]MDR9370098.1 tail fiber domain-containing protein [Conexibacter sp. JD483]